MREVHDLRDQTGTDNAGAEAIAAQRSAAVIGFRSYHRQGLANAAGPTSRHLGRAPYPPCPPVSVHSCSSWPARTAAH